MEYITVGEGLRRTFTITVGLRAGYGPEGPVYHPSMVENAFCQWMEARLRENSMAISGFFMQIMLYYARIELNDARVVPEPGVRFWGEVSTRRHSDKTDEEIVAVLNDLADAFSRVVKQVDITVSYRDMTWVRHAKGLQ